MLVPCGCCSSSPQPCGLRMYVSHSSMLGITLVQEVTKNIEQGGSGGGGAVQIKADRAFAKLGKGVDRLVGT